MNLKYLAVAFLLLPGCATAGSVKKQIASDLNAIAEYQDCPTVCEQLRKYIDTQLVP